MITARAPGKVVLWGEYAVLAGAPALVMAVDRYAVCTIEPGSDGWRFANPADPASTATVTRSALLDGAPPPRDSVWRLAWQVLAELATANLPEAARVGLDTGALYHPDAGKLGLGSSAALCVALCGALGRLLGTQPRVGDAMRAHAALQGGGSGIDVAAAWHGGTLRFARPAAATDIVTDPWHLPADVGVQLVFAGRSASTPRHLNRFAAWRDGGETSPLTELSLAARALFEDADLLRALKAYVQRLEALDTAAGLGIFSAPHRALQTLARRYEVTYKPCGAGGGDVGAGFAANPEALRRFADGARDRGFLPLAVETAPHGIEISQ